MKFVPWYFLFVLTSLVVAFFLGVAANNEALYLFLGGTAAGMVAGFCEGVEWKSRRIRGDDA